MDSIGKLISRAQLRAALEKFRRNGGLRRIKPDQASTAKAGKSGGWWTVPRIKTVLN